jgi:hypothetical protein
LKALSGQPVPALSPELEVEVLLSSGRMPFENICVWCGKETSEQIQVLAECERVQRRGGFSWPALILSWLFLPVRVFYWREPLEYGRDKVYWLPLPVCRLCRSDLQGPAALRHGLRKVEVYRRLLEKFPGAKVRLAGP